MHMFISRVADSNGHIYADVSNLEPLFMEAELLSSVFF
jgi:hypothetical protein